MAQINIFPVLVGIMEFGAAIVYFTQSDYKQAVIWAAYGVAAVVLGTIK